MTETLLYLLLTGLLVVGNGFFVAAEFALVKVRSTQLDVEVQAGKRAAVLARSIIDHLDAYLSATQLGITLTSLGLGWIGEPAVSALLQPLFHSLHLSDELSHRISVVVGFSVISFLHIVVGEVAPKSLAIARPVRVSMAVATPMRAFHLLFYPALIVLNASSNFLLRLVGVEPAGTHSLAVPAEELRQIAAESAAGGQISAHAGNLLDKVFTFSDRMAHDIMVPRTDMQGIDLQAPVGEALTAALQSGHSRYPLYDGDPDKIIGVLHLKDLLPHVLDGTPPRDLRALARKPLFVPGGMPAQRLLRTFQREHTHLAIVLDEFGGVAGVTTLEDTLEELVGEIQDEYDVERDHVEPVGEGFSVTGRLLLAELPQHVGIPTPEADATTLSGYVLERLERVAKVGDMVDLGDWTARVTQIDGRAVQRVLLSPKRVEDQSSPGGVHDEVQGKASESS